MDASANKGVRAPATADEHANTGRHGQMNDCWVYAEAVTVMAYADGHMSGGDAALAMHPKTVFLQGGRGVTRYTMGTPVTTLLSWSLRARVQRAQALMRNCPVICAKTHGASGSPDRCGLLPWTCVNSSFRGDSLRLSSRSFARRASQAETTEPRLISDGGMEEGRPLFASGPPSYCGPRRRSEGDCCGGCELGAVPQLGG